MLIRWDKNGSVKFENILQKFEGKKTIYLKQKFGQYFNQPYLRQKFELTVISKSPKKKEKKKN